MNVEHKMPCPAGRSKLSPLFTGLIAALAPALVAHAAEPASKPVAGSVIAMKFPEMPRTFAGATPQMAVYLPTNYDPARKHPLLIFLRGGNGGDDNNPAIARALAEDKDFVCVSLPLFKDKEKEPNAILIRDGDCEVAWPLYKTMLAKLDEIAPNIDSNHRILGGFSNGAHMTAALINEAQGEAAARFSAFFLIDGGGGVARFDLLKGKPLLMVCGRWRPKPEKPLAAGVPLTIYWMKDSGHAFPESEYPVVRKWLRTAADLPSAAGEPTFLEAVAKAGGQLQDLSAAEGAAATKPAGVPASKPKSIPASSPASRPAVAQGRDETIKIQVGGQTRTCLIHLPPAWDGNRPLPVVIAMHGAGGNGAGMAASTGFSALADKEGFVIAYPNGIGGWSALFGKPIPGGHGAQTDDVDDVGFIRAVIDRLGDTYHVDPLRVYACGHSSGAYMAYRVAIDLSDRVAAAGVVNGSMAIRLLDGKPSLDEIPSPSSPISILHIRGANDGIVKAEGGQTIRVVAKSANDCIRHFVKADGCDPNGRETLDTEHGLVRTLYTGGKAGTEVEMVVVKNAGHNWPSPKEGLSTTQELWDFFSRHPKTMGKPAPSPASGPAVPK